jgi:hypothetical protein
MASMAEVKRLLPESEQGAIARFFVWLLGPNWRTTFWGTLSFAGTGIVTMAVALNQAATQTTPGDIDPMVQYLLYAIPARYRFWIILSGGALTLFGGQRFASNAKSKNVQGGAIQQDSEGNVAEPQEPVPAPPHAAIPKQD